MAVPVWVEVVNKLATPSIAGISALYVYLQYRRAQRWKANDIAASLKGKLDTDPALSLACHALDWGVGPLLIPDEYRPLFPRESTSGQHPSVMQHNKQILMLALEPRLNKSTLQDPQGLVYRYCFIRLFNYFDSVYMLLKDGQLREEDIIELKYWLEKIQKYSYTPRGVDGNLVFLPAIRVWGYDNVTKLADKLAPVDRAEKN